MSRMFAADSLGETLVCVPKEASVANPVPAGSDVSAGTYRCTNCGKEMDVGSTTHLPPCPSCGNGEWETVSGGDSVNDPYPDR
jgi:Zn finger protein HypA/HybF involved in hydrogenase expression